MRKKTSIILDADQQRAIKRVVVDKECQEAEAIRYLIDRGIEAEKLVNITEVLQLKIFYYLRQLASTRGVDFINQIEADFLDVKDDMLEALNQGFSHVGK